MERCVSDSKIKVLVVDDSRIYRGIICAALEYAPDIEVIGNAFNGVKAMEFLKKGILPDIISLDIEMPEMNGIETLKAIQEFNKEHSGEKDIGVVMVSSISKRGADITIEALENGAFDYITKPASDDREENISNLRYQLLSKIRTYHNVKSIKTAASDQKKSTLAKREFPTETEFSNKKIGAVIVGCSTGGPRALAEFLPELTKEISLPIFIVQHMPAFFTLSLAENLNKKCTHTVVEAGDNIEVSENHVYIAPGGKHMLLKKGATNNVLTSIIDSPPENNCKPSVDVFFRSVPLVCTKNVITIILTGMGNDGAKGLRPLKRKGSYIVVQDEQSSVVWGMPGCAVETGYVDKVLPLKEIAGDIIKKIKESN